MARSRRLEAVLEAVKAIGRLETLGAGEIESLRKIIRGKQPIAIAPTTKIIIRHSLIQLIPDMVTAFDRMLVNGADTDPNCKAKWAMA